MFNVLTKDLKKNIQSDYKNRRFFIWLVILVFTFLFITLVATPSFVSVVSEKNSASTFSDSIKNSSSLEDEETKKIFNDTNNLLVFVNNSKPSVYTVDILSKLISLKNSGIKLNDILYQRQSSTTAVFTLKGVASTRDSLINLSKNITSDPLFKDLNLPVSNFAKDRNIEFSFDINVAL